DGTRDGTEGESAGEIAVCSTGLIGERLPMDLVLGGLDAALADASRSGGTTAADAIRTTDTVSKIAFHRADGYTVGGMPKGASKLIAVEVVGAASEQDAVTAGRAVARSNLLKCAIAGEDPNWGRVLSAVGTTDAAFEPERLSVAINGVWVCRNGCAGDDRSKVDLRPRDVTITVDLSAGPHAASVRTTDLTAAYVHENSAYST